MDVYRPQIILGVGLSSAYTIWYAYRTWSHHRSRCGFCQPETHTAHGFIVASQEKWYACSAEVLDRIESSKLIAVDCFWVGSVLTRRKIALLAFCTSAERITFVRLSELGEFPEELAAVFRDPTIIKVGIDILAHAAKLYEDYGIETYGCVDLRYMAMATPAAKRKLLRADSDLSLISMMNVLLDANLSRDYRMLYSRWEARHLSRDQIYYVTGQVIGAFGLAVKIAQSNDWVANAIGYLLKPYLWLDHFIKIHYASYIDLKFSRDRICRHAVPSKPPKPDEKTLRSYNTLKTPLYDNCVLLCPDMEHLCTCDRRKAQWYLDTDLAEKVKDDPLTVRLRFEPAQRAILDAQYYCLVKHNICVVCGSPENLVRKYVVPREYRKHFPKIMKHHNAHDVVLTCLACHAQYCWYEDLFKEQFAKHCNAPLSEASRKFIDNKALREIQRAANALLKVKDNLPEERRQALEDLLKEHFEVNELTDELVDYAAGIDFREANVDFVSHGKKVVDHFAEESGLLVLETMWREYFITKMNPSYLPDMWSPDHHHDILAVKLSFIEREDPREAESLRRKLGITPEQLHDIVERLKHEDNVNFNRINFQRGRLLERQS
ncbi:exonuclease 3'-5' domain-containing protein 2-like [Galendromus occidentalis]|uniref:Exonuclease 3'-5' domain-containing protein 2-like n=1 Tax=Galendromus occidentalis TaxID=34638 RepID=A0AAJ7SHX1_9ACAR|nr:exonuclease 3'-5' domain-containing protein 2-like [Galendromus occidentalis]